MNHHLPNGEMPIYFVRLRVCFYRRESLYVNWYPSYLFRRRKKNSFHKNNDFLLFNFLRFYVSSGNGIFYDHWQNAGTTALLYFLYLKWGGSKKKSWTRSIKIHEFKWFQHSVLLAFRCENKEHKHLTRQTSNLLFLLLPLPTNIFV